MITESAVRVTVSRVGIWLALIALVGFGAARYEGFASAFTFTTFLNVNAILILVAVGLALVMTTGRIDLSVAAVAAVASVAAANLSEFGLAIAVLGAAAVGLAFGAVNAAAILALRLPSVAVTLATMLAGRAIAGYVSRQPAAIDWTTDFTRLGTGRLFAVVPWTILFALAVALAVWLVLHVTPFGRAVRAASDAASEEPKWVVVFVFVFSGLCAGLAGAMLASVFASAQPNGTWGWELAAIAAVLAGGVSIPATVAGAMLVGLVFTLLNFENSRGVLMVTPWWQAAGLALFVLAGLTRRARRAARR